MFLLENFTFSCFATYNLSNNAILCDDKKYKQVMQQCGKQGHQILLFLTLHDLADSGTKKV